jgi:DUF4097 and DUF4098 domain-containing protein YvlB
MKLPLILLFGSCLLAMAETEEKINKQFNVQSGGKVMVEVDFGSITVGTHESDQVKVDILRKVSMKSKSSEEEFLKDRPIHFSQDGNVITIRSQRQGPKINFRLWQRTEAQYKILVPAKFNADLKTSGGGIEISGLTGDTRSRTSGGGLRFKWLKGTVDGDTSGGGIHVEDCEGPVKIHTSGGGIHLTGGGGSLDGDTSGGSVTVKDFRGPVQVHTSGGGITVENVTGQVSGSTSGGGIHAKFSQPLTETVTLETSGGGVTLEVPESSAFNLDARTSGGGVSSELPVTVSGKIQRSHLQGPVNGGGKTVVLRSSGGSIRVKKI